MLLQKPDHVVDFGVENLLPRAWPARKSLFVEVDFANGLPWCKKLR